jgi:hypothetical protein
MVTRFHILIAVVVAASAVYPALPEWPSPIWDTAKTAVIAELRSPGSAVFPDQYTIDDEGLLENGERLYIVHSHVDSQNGFGALMRERWAAGVCYDPATGDYLSAWVLFNP